MTLQDALARQPSVPLAFTPTPLHEVPRFAAALAGPRIFLKREDMTGLATGGNKSRKLQFILGSDQAQGADVFIAGGGLAQSNHARQCAAAARALGMHPVLVLRRGPPGQRRMQGNVLLDYLLGAEIRFVDDHDVRQDTDPGYGLQHVMERIAEEYRALGNHPLVLPTSAVPAGAIGYAAAAVELREQLARIDARPSHLFIASTGSSIAGLMLGARALMREDPGAPVGFRHIGVANGNLTSGRRANVAQLANDAAAILGIPDRLHEDDVVLVQPDDSPYGALSEAAREAILLLARTEGILADPVYTGRGLAALIGAIRMGELSDSDAVIFVHTGGHPALFAYSSELCAGDSYFASE